jgi:uncharacterized protein YcfL
MDVQSRKLQHDYRLYAQRAVVALFVAALAPVASAQVSVEVTPMRVEVKAAGSGQYTNTVSLTNHDKNPVRIHATLYDWYFSKDGTPQYRETDTAMPFSAAAWVRLNPVEQVVQPGASGIVRFTVNIPAGTAPGGYRTAIMFDFGPPGAEGVIAKGVLFKSRVATIVYVTVGSPKPAVELVDVQPRAQAGQVPTIAATLKNTGRVQVRTRGQMLIYDKTGTLVRRVTLPDTPILPESERDVIVAMAEQGQPPLPAGEYRVELRIDLGLPELLVGETTVTIGR